MPMSLRNRHFVVGVTGGIAAYKTCELIRRLQDEGATVQVVITEAGSRFVSALTFQALSGRAVYSDAWASLMRSAPSNGMPHIDLAREADAIVVAPASADFLARLATGQANDLLSSMCLARDIPLLVAPAMNRQMWQQAATQRNVSQLRDDGVLILGPASGAQACNEVGDGRMLEPHEILNELIARFGPQSQARPASALPNIRGILEGVHLLITAGPTYEPIDPVRGITNRSSGRMGYALTQAGVFAGARVTLVSGPVDLKPPEGVRLISVTTAEQMHAAVMKTHSENHIEIFIGVAAVADWRAELPQQEKLKKENGRTLSEIRWVENPDILASIAQSEPQPFCVGFAAETGPDLASIEQAVIQKRKRKKVPMLIGNIGPQTFGKETNQILISDERGIRHLAQGEKTHLAQEIIFQVAQLYKEQQNP